MITWCLFFTWLLNTVLVQVDSVDDYLVSVLHMAVKYGVLVSIKELIEHGADLN
jgi:ankyrin repeat protein